MGATRPILPSSRILNSMTATSSGCSPSGPPHAGGLISTPVLKPSPFSRPRACVSEIFSRILPVAGKHRSDREIRSCGYVGAIDFRRQSAEVLHGEHQFGVSCGKVTQVEQRPALERSPLAERRFLGIGQSGDHRNRTIRIGHSRLRFIEHARADQAPQRLQAQRGVGRAVRPRYIAFVLLGTATITLRLHRGLGGQAGYPRGGCRRHVANPGDRRAALSRPHRTGIAGRELLPSVPARERDCEVYCSCPGAPQALDTR